MDFVSPEFGFVIHELFAPIGSFFLLPAVAEFAAASRASAARVREELQRRDTASRWLRVWGNHPHWESSLMRVCGLDYKPRQWNVLPPMIDGRTDFLCALCDKHIYVCGGVRRGHPTNAVERLVQGKWEILPPLLGRRRVDGDASIAVLQGKLYICGGLSFDGTSASGCVDRFDPSHCHWETLAPMPASRRGAASAVLGDRLYLCGGSPKGSDMGVLSFSPETCEWDTLPPMLNRHYRAQAVTANGTIYVGQRDSNPPPCAGAYSHLGDKEGVIAPFLLANGERFNTETRTWSRCMSALLSSPGASVSAVMSSCLYLCESPSDARTVSQRCVRVIASERSGGTSASGGPRALRRNHTT
eukprot:CAMPEP_0169115626 /NCGR_PEP_ID=MMETSP1015-20121227/29439_1 /TAXON_ID=342587 /ORGANISM="Karlodinium micrum, Strain CCMP2283" /LENGTH=357 /DNA_ID=CAMNT_0009178083 /DNA_START=122 /DNA_END=1195 /DNA_ORIENTATION=-